MSRGRDTPGDNYVQEVVVEGGTGLGGDTDGRSGGIPGGEGRGGGRGEERGGQLDGRIM